MRCILNGGDHDGLRLDLHQPGDEIEHDGQTYRRMLGHDGQPLDDLHGEWNYRWAYPRVESSGRGYRAAP